MSMGRAWASARAVGRLMGSNWPSAWALGTASLKGAESFCLAGPGSWANAASATAAKATPVNDTASVDRGRMTTAIESAQVAEILQDTRPCRYLSAIPGSGCDWRAIRSARYHRLAISVLIVIKHSSVMTCGNH